VSKVVLLSQALQTSLFWSKSISNEGNLILVAGTGFLPYLDYHCIRATEISYMALPAQVLERQQGWSKSVSKDGQFTLEAETIFRPYFDHHYIVATQT
jgi:hypothetical protein